MSRYGYMPKVASMHKCKNILEIGVWSSGTAGNMIKASIEANNYEENINYYGFDLFEDGTTETDNEEFNLKAHNTKSAVIKRLQEFREKMMEKKKVFTFALGKGNSKDILKDCNDLNADFVLIGVAIV